MNFSHVIKRVPLILSNVFSSKSPFKLVPANINLFKFNPITIPNLISYASSTLYKRPETTVILWSRRTPVSPDADQSTNSASNSAGTSKKPPIRNPDLMNFPWVIWPSLPLTMRNWFFEFFIIRPYYDPDFSLSTFREGAKQALVSVSEDLADGNISGLSGRVTPNVITQLTHTVSQLTLKQKTDLRVLFSDIFFSFPYQLGVIFDGEDGVQPERVFVEITMCYHVFRNFEEYLEDRGSERDGDKEHLYNDTDRFTIANYRFIREITKGVNDDWTINIINHFKPGNEVKQ